MEGPLGRLARSWDVPCGSAEVAALMHYGELLLTWSRRINLTAARSLTALVQLHMPDSFALAGALAGDERVVDVGSGGGMPAIPLAVLRPGLALTLVEPVAKKTAFLRTAVRELGLQGRVAVENRRAEDLISVGAAPFDAATSRAALAPPGWAKLGAALVRPGGRVFVLASADPRLDAPGLRVVSKRVYLDGRRWLIALERTA